MAIRTTHVGSLPRTALVADLLFGAEKGLVFEPVAYQRIMDESQSTYKVTRPAIGYCGSTHAILQQQYPTHYPRY